MVRRVSTTTAVVRSVDCAEMEVFTVAVYAAGLSLGKIVTATRRALTRDSRLGRRELGLIRSFLGGS